ncbi:MAG TPA: MaoC/PaaZ C-terminal domain-containing protein [Dehalococcoidia bacterium]|nr:MaoC/PaaZ C-terminal domain-containing protein [Dehalococcoidia bacterium]
MAEQVYWDDVNEGDEIAPIKKNCSTQQLVQWAAASGDFYQIHYDSDFAASTGLDNIIVHGALKNAFLGQLLHDWAAPEGTVREFGCEYRGMDYPNQDITCRGIVTAKSVEGDDHIVELDIWTENPEGQKTTPGIAIVILPAR